MILEALKNLFEKDNLGNAFNAELTKIILDVDSTKISPELISFYENRCSKGNKTSRKSYRTYTRECKNFNFKWS